MELLSMVTGICLMLIVGQWVETPYPPNMKMMRSNEFSNTYPRYSWVLRISPVIYTFLMVFLFLLYAPSFFPRPNRTNEFSLVGLFFFVPFMSLMGDLLVAILELSINVRCNFGRYSLFCIADAAPKVGVRRILASIVAVSLLIVCSKTERHILGQQSGAADALSGRR